MNLTHVRQTAGTTSIRGLGEIAVGLGFGPVMLLGAYWVQTQELSAAAWYVSIPVGILIAAVLYINEIPDRMWDEKAGKRTLVTRVSPEVSITGYAILIGAAYLSILVGVALGVMPVATLLGLLTIPMVWRAYKALRRHHAYAYRLIPANATTVFAHLYTGLLLTAGYVVTGVIARL